MDPSGAPNPRSEPRESIVDRLIDVDWAGRVSAAIAWMRARASVGTAWRHSDRAKALHQRFEPLVRRLQRTPVQQERAAPPATATASPIREARSASVGRSWSRPVLKLAGVVFGVILVGTIAYVADCIYEIPIDGGIVNDAGAGAMLIQAADGSELATRGSPRGDKLSIDDIPANLRHAIVAIEDRRFFDHGALDLRGIARATSRDLLRGHSREGASTLTQQLARLMLLSPDRTLKRKVQEALIAAWLEHHLTKQAILERYLNTAYFGAGAYGVDAAAHRYFGKSARDIDLAEAAMIAGLVRAPSQLAPHRNLQAAQARADLVLRVMVETHVLSLKDAEMARAHPATLKVSPETPSGSGYAADAAATSVKALVGDSAIDVTAATTIDPALQDAAERAVARHLRAEGARRDIGQAALVAIGADGAILAMVGGRDYDESRFNRATQAKRQGGSLFKLFVYLTALKQGATPDTIVVDGPTRIGDWEPHNFEKGYRGRVPLSYAFAHSLNTVAASLAQRDGIPAVIKTAHDLGVTSDLPNVPSLALGTASVDLEEMTRAFASVASDQDTVEPFLVRRIASHDKVLFNRPQLYAGDAEPDAAKVAMRELLADVVREGTGRAAQLPMPVGGKTGTTQDFRDAWFIGSAPNLTVGVWVGNDDNSPMDGETGGDVPAKIWHDFVAEAEKSLAASDDDAPAKATPATTAERPQAAKAPAAPATAAPATAANPASGAAATAVAGLPATAASPASPVGDSAGDLHGRAEILDTATLSVDGRTVVLQGVAPLDGRPARILARYLRRKDVDCRSASGTTYRCSVDGDDLATTIVANGGSPATQDAPPDLLAAQQGAQERRRGLWRRRRR